ncbi:MAG: DUF4124 domain-containing protein [Methylovulum sp.]|nr:DUF4124 domain-containing protein [Methylovulum sp.]
MKALISLSVLVVIATICNTSAADIYKYTDSDGRVYYTTEPKTTGSYTLEGGNSIFTIYNESIKPDNKKYLVLFYVREKNKDINYIDNIFQYKYSCDENIYSVRADELLPFVGKKYAPPDSIIRIFGKYACRFIPEMHMLWRRIPPAELMDNNLSKQKMKTQKTARQRYAEIMGEEQP